MAMLAIRHKTTLVLVHSQGLAHERECPLWAGTALADLASHSDRRSGISIAQVQPSGIHQSRSMLQVATQSDGKRLSRAAPAGACVANGARYP